MVDITVRGQHVSRRPPERATVRLHVSCDGPSRTQVYDTVTRSASAVSDTIAALHEEAAGPVTTWSMDRLRTWSERP